jgi:hypothetical protein
MNMLIERALCKIKENDYRNYFLYAFDKEAVKKKYLKKLYAKEKGERYIYIYI